MSQAAEQLQTTTEGISMQQGATQLAEFKSHQMQPAPAFDLSPRSLDEALKLAEILSASDIVPKDFQRKAGNILVAIQWGMELGLKPLQAMQNIAVINGRPSLWGDAVIALVRNSPLCEYVYESIENGTAICRVKRKGEEEQIRTFSEDDAKKAGLFGKQGPWTQYPKRMLQMRARAFALRDVFPDVLKGIPIAEEVMDFERMRDVTPQQRPQSKAELGEYPQADFDRNLPAWTKALQAGKVTLDDLKAKVETKGRLTDEQYDTLASIETEGDA